MAFLSRAALLVAGALVVLAAAPAAGAGGSVCFDRVFSFGDSLTDTGNFLLSVPDDFPDPARNLPYGQTFFDRSSGRYSDGRNLLDFFDWMKTHHESDLAESDYGMRIDLITRVFGASAAEDFFEKLPPGAKSIEAYTTLLHSYGRSKMTDKAERLFERMKVANLSMDALLYNEMMTLYISVGDLDRVEIIAEEQKRQNVNPDLFTYNLRVSAVAASMDLEGFKGILDEMSKDPNSKE